MGPGQKSHAIGRELTDEPSRTLAPMAEAVALDQASITDYHNARARFFGESNFVDSFLVPLFSCVWREIQYSFGRSDPFDPTNPRRRE
jgi:hypothetical protein